MGHNSAMARLAGKTLQALAAQLPERGDGAAITVAGDGPAETWTYRQLGEAVVRLASGLGRAGLGAGEPVALCFANRPEWAVVFLAVVSAGGIAVPIDTTVAESDFDSILANCSCRRIFLTSAQAKRFPNLGARPGGDIRIVGEMEDAPAGAADWRNLFVDPAPLPPVSPEDVAALLYTSGTTGTPKGIPLTHRNIVANLDALLAEPLAASGDGVFLPLPLHHAYPLTVGLLGALAAGARLVLPTGLGGPQIMRALKGTSPRVMIGVPRLYEALAAGIDARLAGGRGLTGALARAALRLSVFLRRRVGLRLGRVLLRPLHREMGAKLRLLGCGGAHLEVELAWRLEGLGFEVLTGYGLTETSPILAFNTPGRARIGSVGKPVASAELRIAALNASPDGEIEARGASVCSGYWRAPETTREAFTPDGWFRTGDLGHFDADGYLYIVGRLKELIVLPGGKKIFSEALEKIYQQSPLLREVAVVPVGAGLRGLVLPDYDAIRARGAINIGKLLHDEMERLTFALPAYQRLGGFVIAKEPLPRTQLGKLRRHLLPALMRQAEAGAPVTAEPSPADRELLAQPAARALWGWLQRRYPGHGLSLDMVPQLDLGIDSLEWVNLTLRMESDLGLHLGEADLARVVTLRDLLREAIAAKAERPAPTEDIERWLRQPGPALRLLAFVLYWINRALMRSLFGLKVSGLESLPAGGAYVVAPNHASYLDPLVVAAALPFGRLAHVYWAGWTGMLFTGPVARLFSRAARVLPIDPDRSPAASLAVATAALERGLALVWFPEGRRTPSGELLPFQPGLGLLLERGQVPVLPAFIGGTFAAWPPRRRFPRPRPLYIRFGAKLTPQELARTGTGDTVATRITTALRQAVAALEGKTEP
jgi:long-chain acyl-CoA synthetase